MPQLNITQKETAIIMYQDGFSQKYICKLFGVNQSTISRLVQKYENSSSVKRSIGSGRPEKLNRAEKLRLKRCIQKNPDFTARQILNKTDLYWKISRHTLKRYHCSIGLYCRVARKTSIISKKHRLNRLQFAKKYQHYSKEDWLNVIFSDETSIQLSPNRMVIVRRPKSCQFKKRYVIKHLYSNRQSMMFWGYICGNGERYLTHVTGNINSTKYMDTLSEVIHNFPSTGILQQDRAPSHESRSTRAFLHMYNITMLDPWPSNSPDLNIIEHMWAFLKNKVAERRPINLQELKTVVLDEYHKIPREFIDRLYSSLSNRIQEVIRNRGGCTKY